MTNGPLGEFKDSDRGLLGLELTPAHTLDGNGGEENLKTSGGLEDRAVVVFSICNF